MVDLKKFVAYFLVLSTLASSAAFFLSEFLETAPSSPTSQTAALSDNTPPPVSANAFVEKIPNSSLIVDSEPGLPPVILTENLTHNAAQQITREFFRANTEGPEDFEGGKSVNMPSDADIDAALRKIAPEQLSIRLPNFAEAVSATEFTVTTDNSAEALTRYLSALREALNDTILGAEFKNLLKKTPSFEAVAAAQLTHSRAFYKLKDIQVPSAVVELHSRAVKLVLDAKKIIEVPTQSEDPAKTLAVMSQLEGTMTKILAADFEAFSAEVQKLEKTSLLPKNSRGWMAFLVPEAHAILGVPISTAVDINSIGTYLSQYGSWLEQIWEFAQKAILQTLKNMLLKVVQQQVIGWIEGSGDPKFVMDWGDVIAIPYDFAANETIGAITRLLCNGLDVNLRGAFLPVNERDVFGCTLNQVIGNLGQFQNSFNTGGWIGYGRVIQENFFVLSFNAHDIALQDAIAAQQAQANDARAGRGLLSVKKCQSGGKPNKSGFCPDGSKPIITTPGKAVGDALAGSLDYGAQTVINADDIAGLAAAIIDSALNRVIQMGLEGIRGGLYSQPPANRNVVTLCSNLGGQAGADCLNSAVTADGTQYVNRPQGGTPDTATIIPVFNATTSQTGTGTSTSTPQVQCLPAAQVVELNPLFPSVSAYLFATGGDGVNYSWSAPGGSPNTGTGDSFTVNYSVTSSRPYEVRVSSAGFNYSCTVTVSDPRTGGGTTAPTSSMITVGTTGAGFGTITASLFGSTSTTGIDCSGAGTDCTEIFPVGTMITLTATPRGTTSSFAGWDGVCKVSGTLPTCTLQLAAQSVIATAQFDPAITPPGGGGALSCRPALQDAYISPVTLESSWAVIDASGGTGTYSWSAPGNSSQLTQNGGMTLWVKYRASSTTPYQVTVTSGANNATCSVNVPR